MLQETHSVGKIEKLWRSEWGGKIWYSHGTSNSAGVAILTDKKCPFKPLDTLSDKSGRFLLVRGEMQGERILFANLYGPNRDDPEYFQECFKNIEKMGIDRKIIGGDLNAILDNSTDRSEGIHKRTKVTHALNIITETMRLSHVWKIKEKLYSGYTWRRKFTNRVLSERLDYLLFSESMVQYLSSVGHFARVQVRSFHSHCRSDFPGNQKRTGILEV